ncbi:MAG TPA: hypothetical protein VIM16_00850 [Mucilaginibacter sp.]|jgi:hypothetical protein
MKNAVYPKYKAWKANGISPAAGYYLYTYASGGTTLKTTYSDADLAGIHANTNPIILDANGEAVIFLNSGPYRFDLKTPGGALINTFDPIEDVQFGIGSVLANPTGLVGLTAVNGVALTVPRSDSSPALNQAIAPIWTGVHTWNPIALANSLVVKSAVASYNPFFAGYWTPVGGGLTFGTTIQANPSGTNNSSWASRSVSNLGGLHVEMIFDYENSGNVGVSGYVDLSGIGIGPRNYNPTLSPFDQSPSQSARGAWMLNLTGPGQSAFIGWNNSQSYATASLSAGVLYQGNRITIDVSADLGANTYNVTTRLEIPMLSIDQTRVLTIDNNNLGTNGFIVIDGPYQNSATDIYKITSLFFSGTGTGGAVGTERALKITTSTGVEVGWVNYEGDSYFQNIEALHSFKADFMTGTGTRLVTATATGAISNATLINGANTWSDVQTFSSTIVGNISGNAATATALQTTRAINGVNFNGTAAITVTAAAGTLTGATLNATVLASSLTSVGTIATGVWNGMAVVPGYGGTGLTTYATGDILYASAANTLSKLAATTNGFVLSLVGGIPSWVAGAALTNPMTTLGDMLYGGAAGAPTRLAGQTTSGIEFLSQTGTGSASTAPVWTAATGTGNVVLSISPTLVTPALGVATATSVSIAGSVTPISGTSVEIDYGAIASTGRIITYDRTGSVYKAMRIGPNLDIAASGDLSINNGKFTVAASTGNTTVAGDVNINAVGKGLYIKEGTNATMGVTTLVLGISTVSTTKVTTVSRIFLSVESIGTVTIPTAVAVTGRLNGTSFTITSANATDTSVISWLIVEPA